MSDPTEEDFMKAARVAWGPLMFQAARSARDLGVLKVLVPGALSPLEVAEKARVSLYAARVLLEACSAMELTAFDGEKYTLTKAGEVMLTDPMTQVNMNFVHDVCYVGAVHLRESLEQGKPVGLSELGAWPTVYEGLTQLPETFQKSWFAFDHFYSDPVFRHAIAAMVAAGVKSVLDVGGNTGRFAVQAAKKLAVTVLDHPAQLQLTAKNAETNGVTVGTHPINLLDHSSPFPAPFDAVWMSQLLDCFPESDIVSLLKRARAALSPNGRVCVLEPLWDRQPHAAARYNVQATSLYFTCIANGTSRMYHSADLIRCAAEAGLKVADDQQLGPWHTLLVFKA